MSRRTRTASVAVILVLSVGAGSAAAANSSADTAALQVALWARGVYVGPVDGVFGPVTAAGVRALQNKLGLPSSGVLGRAPVERSAAMRPRRSAAAGSGAA